MSVCALIPVKARAAAKRRLANVLSADERRELVDRMLAHVLWAAAAAERVTQIAIVSPERSCVQRSVMWINDAAKTVNEVLSAAAAELSQEGFDRVIILPADLPTVTSAEIDALIIGGERSGIALAPDRHLRGTNAFYQRLPIAVPYHFGPDSWTRHLALAGHFGRPHVSFAPGLMLDIDEAEDLELLVQQPSWNNVDCRRTGWTT